MSTTGTASSLDATASSDAEGGAVAARRWRVGRGAEVGMTGFRHSNGWIFGTMLVSALLSLLAGFELAKDAVILAGNPNAELACNISATISCGTVGQSWQAEVFGFPNAFLGLMFEPMVITLAIAGLSGVAFPRWFVAVAQVVYLFAITFALWLFTQSVWVIGALCPWCMLVTLGTTLVFFTLLHYNVRENNLYLPARAQAKLEAFVRSNGDVAIQAVLILGILAIIVLKYGTRLFA